MKKTLIIALHLGYWVLFAGIWLLFFKFLTLAPHSGGGGLRLAYWVRLILGFAFVPALIAFYSSYTFLFDRYLAPRRFAAFVVGWLLAGVLGALGGALAASTSWLFGPRFLFGDGYRSVLPILGMMTIGAWINGVTGAILRGAITWYSEIRVKELLRRKNQEMELLLIKSRINPHFLFNTLNNIDVLIGVDPVRASAYLNKLSGLMRFLLYETTPERIRLERELTYLEQYIELQKIRTSNAGYVQYFHSGDISQLEVAPMLFMPFVENAFKHTEGRKGDSQILIRIGIEGNELQFSCRNTFHEGKHRDDGAGGIGNELIRRRLSLLYPGNHQLTMGREADQYAVTLVLRVG